MAIAPEDPGRPLEPSEAARSISELVSELSAQTTTLVRQEIRLAAAEMKTKLTAALWQVALIGLGVLLASASGLALIAAAVIGLGAVLPYWLAALLMAAALGGCACAAMAVGRRGMRRLELAPRETLESLKETETWVKGQLR